MKTTEPATSPAIAVEGLCHRYGQKVIYQELNFAIPRGSVCGLLGKNGQGKTTLVDILMGFLQPTAGRCLIFGEESHNLSPATRRRVGLLHESHLAYEFLTIAETERFFRGCYANWRAELFYRLIDRMGLPLSHKVRWMSCGQRSQLVLGVIMAQNPDLLILDDYSMGLDAGYRRLFLEVLNDFVAQGDKTVLVTSHIVQDLEQLVDTLLFLDQGRLYQTDLARFMAEFRKYVISLPPGTKLAVDGVISGVERRGERHTLYSFLPPEELSRHLFSLGLPASGLAPAPMSLEDGFIGLTGGY
jgi:ABC-2 type transport system ATP-binding protein